VKIGIPKENYPGERRVAGTPSTVERLLKMGFTVLIETGAGEGAAFPDELYVEAGATWPPPRSPSGVSPISS
jgi:NAD(P) transhydrogenase subunit alpha